MQIFISPLRTYYRKTYVLPLSGYFFVSFLSLLMLSSQNQRMDGSSVFYEQLGFGVALISRDWFVASFPYFRGDGQIAPNFAEKCDVALICRVVLTKRRNI